MNARTFLFGAILAGSLAWGTPCSAIVYLEIHEVPGVKPGARNASIYLSERFSRTAQGRRYLSRKGENWPRGTSRVRLFQCLDVLKRAEPGETRLVVDVSKQRAYLMVGAEMALETDISTAREGKITPTGSFQMTERVKDGKISTFYDVEMPYWMRLNDTAYGLHAGYLPGYPASAGCIRLPGPAAKLIFEHTAKGTPVRIQERWEPVFDFAPVAREVPAAVRYEILPGVAAIRPESEHDSPGLRFRIRPRR